MNHYTDHAAGLAELQTELGDDCPVFTFASSTIKCLPGGARRAKELEDGGFGMDADLSLTALVAEVSGTPETLVASLLKSQITYLSKIYRVESVTIAPGGLQFSLTATDLNKGV